MTGKRPVGYGRGAMMRCASAYDALGGSAVGVSDDVYSGLGLSRVDAAAAEVVDTLDSGSSGGCDVSYA